MRLLLVEANPALADAIIRRMRRSGHAVDWQADGLAAAAHGYLEQIRELLAQVRSDIGGDPDAVFLTGGMSRAGYLRQAVAEAFPGARMVQGEPSLGVGQGLALAAASQD